MKLLNGEIMKILKKDLKKGLVKVKIETPDDAWKLESLLEEEDLISAKSPRSIEILRGDKKEKAGKKLFFIKISLEKKEFHEYSGKLRLTGKIIEGPDNTLGSYHTITAEEGKIINIEKNWKKWQIEKLKKSLIKQPRLLICIMDERKSSFFEVTDKIKKISDINNEKPGKQFGESDSKKYFKEIINFLKNKKDYEKIILAGPGFTKEDLYKEIDGKNIEIKKNISVASCSHAGENGLQEIIKKGVIDKITRESRISFETRIVEDFFDELSKENSIVTYGKNEVKEAVEMGAVEKLLVSEKELKKHEKLMDEAERKGAEILIISEEHESGQKLSRLGGIAAFLRFKIN